MAKQVRWTQRAIKDRRDIFLYWSDNNKSNSYSIRLDILFEETAEHLARFPKIGKTTNKRDVRFFIVRNYTIFYKSIDGDIFIMMIWDNRQNPHSLKL